MNEQDLKEYASVVRELIKHENELTNHRLTWLLILQGILFAGAATFWDIHVSLISILALLGIVTSASAFYALWLSKMGRRELRAQFANKLKSNPEFADSIPPVNGDSPEAMDIGWANPWIFIPWAVIVAWISLMICRFIVA